MLGAKKTVLISTLSALLGAALVLTAVKIKPALFSRWISSSQPTVRTTDDPFEQLNRMRENLEQQVDDFPGKAQTFSGPLGSWFIDQLNGHSNIEISQREDNDNVYYDVKLDDPQSTSIDTKIEDGYLTITGTTEKRSGGSQNEDSDSSISSMSKSTFKQTFPLPASVDQKKMEMIPEKDKIVLKFPKLKM